MSDLIDNHPELATYSPKLDNENGELISRQAAIDELIAFKEAHKADRFTGDFLHWTGIKAMIEELPSVHPDVPDTNVGDMISRQAAIKAICERECDALKPCQAECKSIWAIEELPSAQPEIIRCKDCKNYYFADNRVPSEQSWVCDAWGIDQTAHMGYCFKAERKEE